MYQKIISSLLVAILVFACKKKEDSVAPAVESKLIFKFKFDPTQERLDGFGQPATIPSGHAGISPIFNGISAHYFELTPNEYTQLGAGAVLYHAPEVTTGGETAIDFAQSKVVKEGEAVLEIPLKDIAEGSYKYLRVSLAYQNYTIKFKYDTYVLDGTIASFIGYKTYIQSYKIKEQSLTVNANKAQGYWGFEASGVNYTSSGQAPGTTVPNPLAATSPIPAGSCVVTAKFDNPLTVSHSTTKDITVTMSLSTNKSFEWEDTNANAQWDAANEKVTDMGIRGMLIRYE